MTDQGLVTTYNTYNTYNTYGTYDPYYPTIVPYYSPSGRVRVQAVVVARLVPQRLVRGLEPLVLELELGLGLGRVRLGRLRLGLLLRPVVG
jgi:hypothetical protein